MISAPPQPIPTAHDAKVSTYMVYGNAAQAANGKIVFKGRCFVVKRSRVCHVLITGDAPQDLRVTVWATADSFMFAARDWKRNG